MAIFTDFEAQKRIDDEINKYQKLIISLSIRRNALSAINRLPDDVLAQIYLAYKSLLDVAPAPLELGKRPRPWGAALDVTGICARWRNVALDTPRLYSTITLTHPSWMIEGLARSKEAPLRVAISPGALPRTGRTFFRKAAEALAPAMKRTEDLSISSRESDILVLLRALGNVPVPCLRKLTLEHHNGNPSYDDDAAIEISLPWTTLPFLTSLELRNIIPLAPPVLPSLQSLSIIIPPDERQLSVPWVVDLLRNTPQVEEVDVSSLASTNATAVSGPLPVSLPRLRQLTVTAEFLLESKLFEYLDIPQTAAIDVMLRNQINDPHADDLSPLQALHARPFESGLPLFMSIAVNAYPETYQYSLLMRGSDRKLFTLSLAECATSAVSQSIQLCRSLPLNQVHDLRIFAYANLEITLAWAKLLPLLINLQSVTTDCKTVLRELTADSPDTKDLCNPKLESVVLKEEGHIDRGEEEGDDWPVLVRAFKYQYEKGRPIKSLSISSCDIQKEYVDDLKVYTEVDWDGVEVYSDDDDEN